MTDDIDEVARAMWETDRDKRPYLPRWEDASRSTRTTLRRYAMAAIEAMQGAPV